MSRLTDSSGKTWALMSCKDSVGRIYIRAYRNRWDPEKKSSFVEARLQVGRLQQDGSVSLSDRFEETFRTTEASSGFGLIVNSFRQKSFELSFQ